MRSLVLVLVILFLFLQYKLWFDKNGLSEVWHLKKDIAAQTVDNLNAKRDNETLAAEVSDLKNGNAAIEERARHDLGMIKKDETFYQILNETPKK